MSSCDDENGAEAVATCLDRAAAILAAALADPGRVPDAALQNLMRQAVRFYAVKAEAGLRAPFPRQRSEVSADDVMILATDMLHALNVQVFELSMWQAMTGNCIDPNSRVWILRPEADRFDLKPTHGRLRALLRAHAPGRKL